MYKLGQNGSNYILRKVLKISLKSHIIWIFVPKINVSLEWDIFDDFHHHFVNEMDVTKTTRAKLMRYILIPLS